MKATYRFGVCAALVLTASACAQQEEPTVFVAPEPVFDKFDRGGGGCVGGQTAGAGDDCIPTGDPNGQYPPLDGGGNSGQGRTG